MRIFNCYDRNSHIYVLFILKFASVSNGVTPLSSVHLADASITFDGLSSTMELTVNPQLLHVGTNGALSFRTVDSSGIILHISWALPDNSTDGGYDFFTVEIFEGLLRMNGNFSGGRLCGKCAVCR